MFTVLLLLVIAFFGSAIIYGLIEGAKECFGMTTEEANKILEDQRRKATERTEQKELHKSLYDEDDYIDDEDDDEDDLDDILYGDLDKQLDDFERYGIGPDPDELRAAGGYANPELHERKEEREFKKWLKQIK